MFDFRYHALSLVAVFLALTIGLLLGVAIGDKGLVSGAERDLRSSLRRDVRNAEAQSAKLRAQIGERDSFERESYPLLAGGRLAGNRVGLIALGGVSDTMVRDVRDSLDATGGKLVSVSVVREPLDLAALAGLAGGRFAPLAAQPGLAALFGERVGVGFGAGTRLVERVRRQLLSSFSGTLAGLDDVVLVRADAGTPAPPPAQATALAAFEKGLVTGLQTSNVTVVGAEQTSTTPSQIGWFKGQRLTSVDDLDQLAGKVALVFALAGADGTYGVKDTADSLLPKASAP